MPRARSGTSAAAAPTGRRCAASGSAVCPPRAVPSPSLMSVAWGSGSSKNAPGPLGGGASSDLYQPPPQQGPLQGEPWCTRRATSRGPGSAKHPRGCFKGVGASWANFSEGGGGGWERLPWCILDQKEVTLAYLLCPPTLCIRPEHDLKLPWAPDLRDSTRLLF